MAPLIVLLTSLLAFRGLGALGVGALTSWPLAACYALAVMFTFTASAHFTRMRADLVAMTPPWVPFREQMVTFTGLCELAGAVGLLIPATRVAAGLALVALMLALFPANVYAARHAVALRGRAPTPLVLRTLIQAIFIGALLWGVLS